VGADAEIQRLEIRLLCTDDPEERDRILRLLADARHRREFLRTLPGQQYLRETNHKKKIII